MTLTVTMEQLRAVNANATAYNRLARRLDDLRFKVGEDKLEQYVDCDHRGPVTLTSILRVNGVRAAYWALRAIEALPSIDAPMLALYCAKMSWHKAAALTQPDGLARRALEVAEDFLFGRTTEEQFRQLLKVVKIYDWSDVGSTYAAWRSAIAAIDAVGLSTIGAHTGVTRNRREFGAGDDWPAGNALGTCVFLAADYAVFALIKDAEWTAHRQVHEEYTRRVWWATARWDDVEDVAAEDWRQNAEKVAEEAAKQQALFDVRVRQEDLLRSMLMGKAPWQKQ